MPDFQIVFATKAELEGAKQMLAATERQIGSAKAAGEAYDHLQAKAEKARAAIANSKVEGAGEGLFGKVKEGLGEIIPGFDKVTSIASKLASGPLGAVAVGFGAAASAIEVAKKGLENFAEAQERVSGLDAALAQTGQLTDEYREKLQELASQLQETTGVADDQWIGVLKRLTQFGANSTNIEKYSDAVKNLAGLMEGDVQGAATVFSKALQGQFDAFTRYGIVVDDAGTSTEKLDRLMEQLATRGGGQLEASNRTINGQYRQLANSVSDFFEAIGRLIARTGVLQRVLSALVVAFDWWGKVIGGVVPKVEGLNNASQKTVATFGEAEKAAKEYAKQLEGVKEQADKGALALEKAITKVHALARAQEELSDAKMALELAKIDQREQRGQLTPEQAIRLRAATRASFQGAKELSGDQALGAEKAMLEQRLQKNQQEMMRLEERALKAEYAQSESRNTDQKRAALDKTMTGQVERAKARLAEFEASPTEFEDSGLGIGKGNRSFDSYGWIQSQLHRQIYAAEQARKAKLEAFEKVVKETSQQLQDRAKARRAEAVEGQEKMAQENAKAQDRMDQIDTDVQQRQKKRGLTQKTDQVSNQTAVEKQQAEDRKKAEEKSKHDAEVVAKYYKDVNEAIDKGQAIPEKSPEVLAVEKGDMERERKAQADKAKQKKEGDDYEKWRLRRMYLFNDWKRKYQEAVGTDQPTPDYPKELLEMDTHPNDPRNFPPKRPSLGSPGTLPYVPVDGAPIRDGADAVAQAVKELGQITVGGFQTVGSAVAEQKASLNDAIGRLSALENREKNGRS
jgi:hypothetical protein